MANHIKLTFCSSENVPEYKQKAGEAYSFEDSSVEIGLNLKNLNYSSLEQFQENIGEKINSGIYKYMIDIRTHDNLNFFWQNLNGIFEFMKANQAESIFHSLKFSAWT